MGNKSHPYASKIGVENQLGLEKKGLSIWYFKSNKEYRQNVHEDIQVRKIVKNVVDQSLYTTFKIVKERNYIKVIFQSHRTQALVGAEGCEIKRISDDIETKLKRFYFNQKNLSTLDSSPMKVENIKITCSVEDVYRAEFNPFIIAREIALKMKMGADYRRYCTFIVEKVAKEGMGILIQVGGRLGGARIARSMTFKRGNISRNTLRSDIMYAQEHAQTKSGICGVKVTIL